MRVVYTLFSTIFEKEPIMIPFCWLLLGFEVGRVQVQRDTKKLIRDQLLLLCMSWVDSWHWEMHQVLTPRPDNGKVYLIIIIMEVIKKNPTILFHIYISSYIVPNYLLTIYFTTCILQSNKFCKKTWLMFMFILQNWSMY